MEFAESNKDNPLSFFDELYTHEGMKKIEKLFHNKYWYHQSTPHCKYDKKEKTYHLYEQCSDEGDYEMNYYSFKEFFEKRIKKEFRLAEDSFKLRIKSYKEQDFSLKISLQSINRFEGFIESNVVPFKEGHSKFLKKLKSRLIKIYDKYKIDNIDPSLTKRYRDQTKKDLLKQVQNSLQIFEGVDDLRVFTELVLNKDLTLTIDKARIKVNCELWVFKLFLKRINKNLDLSWKYIEIERSGLFWDQKKEKLITAKRITDAKPKSTNKEKLIQKKIDEILPE